MGHISMGVDFSSDTGPVRGMGRWQGNPGCPLQWLRQDGLKVTRVIWPILATSRAHAPQAILEVVIYCPQCKQIVWFCEFRILLVGVKIIE